MTRVFARPRILRRGSVFRCANPSSLQSVEPRRSSSRPVRLARYTNPASVTSVDRRSVARGGQAPEGTRARRQSLATRQLQRSEPREVPDTDKVQVRGPIVEVHGNDIVEVIDPQVIDEPFGHRDPPPGLRAGLVISHSYSTYPSDRWIAATAAAGFERSGRARPSSRRRSGPMP